MCTCVRDSLWRPRLRKATGLCERTDKFRQRKRTRGEKRVRRCAQSFFSAMLCLGAVEHASASGLWMIDMLPSKWEFDAIRSLCRTSVARLKFTRTAGNRSLSTHWLQPLQKWGVIPSCQLRSSLCTEVGKKKQIWVDFSQWQSYLYKDA